MESNIIGMMKIYPLTAASKQVLTLRYLTPLGEYQEVSFHSTFTSSVYSIYFTQLLMHMLILLADAELRF